MRDSIDTRYFLPRYTPSLSSGADPLKICGEISYTFINPDPEIFSNFLPAKTSVTDTQPSFNSYSTDVEKIPHVSPFSKYYSLGI